MAASAAIEKKTRSDIAGDIAAAARPYSPARALDGGERRL
jgi:hypothetical protein